MRITARKTGLSPGQARLLRKIHRHVTVKTAKGVHTAAAAGSALRNRAIAAASRLR